MLASPEMQAWLRRLQVEERTVGQRNRYLAWALGGAVALLLVAVFFVYRATIGDYAVIGDIQIEQNPAQPGRLQLKYRVLSPGRVACRRESADMQTDVVDRFFRECDVDRPWAWDFRPGADIRLTLWYRSGLLRRSSVQTFSTPEQADIVVLIDTTGSMDASIAALKEKCVAFSRRLQEQSLRHRFALLGFGDTDDGDWLDRHEFTADGAELRRWVEQIKRFDGGDLPESALDALSDALRLPFDEHAMRYFYLVTDAAYHDPAKGGQTAADVAARLRQERVLLRVFSRPEHEAAYQKLLGDTGRFDEIENFGRVLSEGRILED
jgi:hypothetical protein